MKKHNFKIGDRVRLKYPNKFNLGTKVCIVISSERCGDEFIPVWYEGLIGSYFPIFPQEIEHVTRVGEQLMFSFMQ